LAVALAEMAIASGVGFRVTGPCVDGPDGHAALFSEAPSRVVVCVTGDGAAEAVAGRAADAGLVLARLGRAGGDRIMVDGLLDLPLEQATRRWRTALSGKLGGPVG